MATIKAFFSFVQVLLFIIGIIPVDTNISYTNGEYQPPQITNPMYIVQGGKSDFVIVTSDNADECILTAVNEMQTYISKISGVTLEHITESEYTEGSKAIIIGETEIEKNIATVDRIDIGADGFMLCSDGTNLLIAGGDSRGTLYGVYTFLEEYLGVRWFTPELEVVPESKDIVID
ncbi:MAG: alpha-glucuronidase family glycosyl hydrolase, partial [Acutalibacteraceae bacterium]|nr:alpha-glucuronidase family glycosyl hydrolase [Acutalibacteraceae bacterium]